MPVIREFYSEKLSLLSTKENLGNDVSEFNSEAAYVNWVRIRIMSVVILVIFSILLIIDIINASTGKWSESDGYFIITCVHFFLIVFLTAIQFVLHRKNPANSDEIDKFHHISNCIILYIVFFSSVLLSFGDMLAYSSLAAYLGTSFAYASIFVMTNSFSIILYVTNMAFMIIALLFIQVKFGISIENQIINTVAFSIVAWFMSRVLFYYSLKDFINRKLISNQNKEILDQNEKNEELIVELKNALSEVKTLQGFLPICAKCKKIRDDKGYWQQLEIYIQDRSDAEFTHGICPDCVNSMYPDLVEKMRKKREEAG